jgi:hypothetical protein
MVNLLQKNIKKKLVLKLEEKIIQDTGNPDVLEKKMECMVVKDLVS